jgi:hypothetical protein
VYGIGAGDFGACWLGRLCWFWSPQSRHRGSLRIFVLCSLLANAGELGCLRPLVSVGLICQHLPNSTSNSQVLLQLQFLEKRPPDNRRNPIAKTLSGDLTLRSVLIATARARAETAAQKELPSPASNNHGTYSLQRQRTCSADTCKISASSQEAAWSGGR